MPTQSLFQSPQLDKYVMLGEEQGKDKEERVETRNHFLSFKRLEVSLLWSWLVMKTGWKQYPFGFVILKDLVALPKALEEFEHFFLCVLFCFGRSYEVEAHN